jgi:hypothetical protein
MARILFLVDTILRFFSYQTGPLKCSKCSVTGLIRPDFVYFFFALHIDIKGHQTELIDFGFKIHQLRGNLAIVEFIAQRFSENRFQG